MYGQTVRIEKLGERGVKFDADERIIVFFLAAADLIGQSIFSLYLEVLRFPRKHVQQKKAFLDTFIRYK